MYTTKVLTQTPFIARLSGFSNMAECEGIIQAAMPMLTPSTVLDATTGAFYTMEGRTSSSAHFYLGHPAVKELEERISVLVGLPVDHGEPVQVQRYAVGQEYRPHFDWFSNTPGGRECMRIGGQRRYTVVLYLSDVAAGGETVFPSLGVTVKPKCGDALLFHNADAHGVGDDRTLHGGAPVISGTKWIVTKWIRQQPYR